MKDRFIMMTRVQTDIGGEPLLARIRDSGIPVLGLLGDKDGIIKTSVGEYYAQVLPKAQFVIVPGAGHDIQNTATPAFVNEARQFWLAHDR
jgi:pimeloyl-ACP methyl ester carboxylesterase